MLAREPSALRELQRQVARKAVPTVANPGGADDKPPVERARIAFSLIFFNDSAQVTGNKYQELIEITRFGDRRGFEAVWIPERPFHPFGGIFPSPATLCATLAGLTEQIRLRAGSVVLPLEHPIRVVEAWSMVDNLSQGRVDLAFASGWNPNDFVLAPASYPELRKIWHERIPEVQRLWRGEKLGFTNGKGEETKIEIFPKPIQDELSVWLAITSQDESFVHAGAHGYNVLTMLKGISLEELARKINLYREARKTAGHDPAAGKVTLMLHTMIHEDADLVRDVVRQPFSDYIKSGLRGHLQAVERDQRPDEAEIDRIVAYSFERYYHTAALFGTPESCREMVDRVIESGVNEIACLLNFGVDSQSVSEGLGYLDELKQRYHPSAYAPAVVPRQPCAASQSSPAQFNSQERESAKQNYEERTGSEPIAIIGVSGRFPGAPDRHALWQGLVEGRELLSELPADRLDDARPITPRAGLLDEVHAFDAALFGITPREAATMDPHQRVFLEVAWSTIEDAGYAPDQLDGSDTGVFVAMYNTDFVASQGVTGPLNAFSATGSMSFMVANRLSHVLGLRGPSEVVNTACSSSLVAVHRAVNAIRAGECCQALVGGVSLLLRADRIHMLNRLGLISPEGVCRPFDKDTTGQVIGEGAGAVLLKPLSRALADGDYVHGVLRATGVNHHGNDSGSLTMPNAAVQADLIRKVWQQAGVTAHDIDYLEAHGAGGYGDIVELNAFLKAFRHADSSTRREPCPVGTLKPNLGFLEAAGGMTQLTKVLAMFAHQTIPPTLNHAAPPAELDLAAGPFTIPTQCRPWVGRLRDDGRRQPLRAGIHAYGLGGSNAHLLVEQYIAPARSPPECATVALVLSARSHDALLAYARRLRAFLASGDLPPLADIAFTLQIGRTAFPHRLAVLASESAGAIRGLDRFLAGQNGTHLYSGVAADSAPSPAALDDLAAVARAWVAGANIDWRDRCAARRSCRCPLPTYPFEREVYRPPPTSGPICAASNTTATTRTLVHQCDEPHVAGHRVLGESIMPAALFLTDVLAAAPDHRSKFTQITWHSVCPVPETGRALEIRFRSHRRAVEFEVAGQISGQEMVHCSGQICDASGPASQPPDVTCWQDADCEWLDSSRWYRHFASLGAELSGPLRSLRDIRIAGDTLLARVASDHGIWDATMLLDAAFQSCSALIGDRTERLFLPFAADSIEIFQPLPTTECFVLTRLSRWQEVSGFASFQITLFDAHHTCAVVTELGLRQMAAEELQVTAIMRRLAAGDLDVAAAEAEVRRADAGAGKTVPPLVERFCDGIARVHDDHEPLDLVLVLKGEVESVWSLHVHQGHGSVRCLETEPESTSESALVLEHHEFEDLIQGRIDPTMFQLNGGLALGNSMLERKIGEAFFSIYNRRCLLGRFHGHLIRDIYETGRVRDSHGGTRRIYPWSIPAEVGCNLYDLVVAERLGRTLEIGMAYGLTTLFFCEAHRQCGSGRHVAIDPCQKTDFLDIGRQNIAAAGLDPYLDFLEQPDYLALPGLAQRGTQFDLVFIDGLHMFDYTLLDFFYSDLLLEQGGLVAFDDSQLPGVQRVVDFVSTNRNYERLDSPSPRLTLFRKLTQDARSLANPNHFQPF